jgi:hypothetical protein
MVTTTRPSPPRRFAVEDASDDGLGRPPFGRLDVRNAATRDSDAGAEVPPASAPPGRARLLRSIPLSCRVVSIAIPRLNGVDSRASWPVPKCKQSGPLSGGRATPKQGLPRHGRLAAVIYGPGISATPSAIRLHAWARGDVDLFGAATKLPARLARLGHQSRLTSPDQRSGRGGPSWTFSTTCHVGLPLGASSSLLDAQGLPRSTRYRHRDDGNGRNLYEPAPTRSETTRAESRWRDPDSGRAWLRRNPVQARLGSLPAATRDAGARLARRPERGRGRSG